MKRLSRTHQGDRVNLRPRTLAEMHTMYWSRYPPSHDYIGGTIRSCSLIVLTMVMPSILNLTNADRTIDANNAGITTIEVYSLRYVLKLWSSSSWRQGIPLLQVELPTYHRRTLLDRTVSWTLRSRFNSSLPSRYEISQLSF